MNARIVARVLERLAIEGVRRGNRFWSQCPNGAKHARGIDTNASWMIRTDGDHAGKHHCFTCKYGGSIHDLVKSVRGLETLSAARAWVEEVAANEGRDPVFRVTTRVSPVIDVWTFNMPDGVVFGPMAEWSPMAREYAVSRGITPEQVDRHGIGYAVQGRCECRIVIVVRDAEFRPVNYTGRTFVDEGPRYLNATTQERPDLDVLFGEHVWCNDTIVVTEGALNALAIENVAPPRVDVGALNGSQVRTRHVLKLARFKRVILATDPDPAGDACAASLWAALTRHTETERIRFAVGTDAAKLATTDEGRKSLRALVWDAVTKRNST